LVEEAAGTPLTHFFGVVLNFTLKVFKFTINVSNFQIVIKRKIDLDKSEVGFVIAAAVVAAAATVVAQVMWWPGEE
jgi:hypothetical protein